MPHSRLRQARLDMCLKLTAMGKSLVKCLGEEFCPPPGLDMLLELYVAEHERRATYIWSLCTAAHIPFSTAHRKVALLEERGLLAREPAVRDRRRVSVRMTREGFVAVDGLLDCFLEIWSHMPPGTKKGSGAQVCATDPARNIGL